jgi:hypothetical protein
MGKGERQKRNLVGKSEGKRPLRRRRRRWEDNIGVNIREGGLEGVEWMHLAQDRDQL